MSYSNYSTYLKYKNCCRPIGDTGPTGPAGPVVNGNKGEILYFSEDNILDSTNIIFINNGNVAITGNLSMDNNFINDVSGIYFSDGTYIGDGSSFDIKTKQLLDINSTGGISVTGKLTVKDATTFQSDTTLNGNLIFGPTENITSSCSTTVINSGDLTINAPTTINNNLSMDDNFINDVSGIYFSDGTYIGHGSSFDITTSEKLDISAASGIYLNTDVTVNSNITINSNLIANTIHTQRLLFPGGNYIDYQDGVGELYVNGNTTLAHRVQIFSTLDVSGVTTIRSSLDVSGNLSMNNNFIKDVYTIDFSNGSYIQDKHGELRIESIDGLNITTGFLGTNHYGKFTMQNNNNLRFNNDNTYITSNTVYDKLSLYGNSIFMEAGVNGDFTFTGNSNNVDLNFLTQSTSGFTINYKDSDDKLRFNVNDLVIDESNNYIGIQTDSPSATLEVSGNVIINGNLSMNDKFINDVSGIYFTQGNLLFSDFSSSTQQVQLPSSQGQPISLERKTLFYDDNFNINTGGSPIDISFVDATFNQLGLTISGSGNTIISPSLDISGQYVEIYANFLVNSTSGTSKTIALDISGVSPGSLFNETIDVRSISKQGSYYITFGPHIFTPEQWADTSEFVITANTTDTFNINKYKLMFKSYFM